MLYHVSHFSTTVSFPEECINGGGMGRYIWLGFFLDYEVQAEIVSLFVEVCL